MVWKWRYFLGEHNYTFIFNFITMRQRNFLLLLLLAIFMGLFTSCTKESEGEPAPPGQWITFQEGTSYSANGTGETLTDKFTTTESWSLSVQEEWMEVTLRGTL